MNKDQLRESILGTAAWNKVGIELLNEAVDTTDKVADKEVVDKEVIEEEAVEHSCPLCSTVLEEAISDEVLLEHADQMLEVFQEAENIIVESEKEEEEGDEEDLLEGLDDGDIQFLAKMSRELKSKKVETK